MDKPPALASARPSRPVSWTRGPDSAEEETKKGDRERSPLYCFGSKLLLTALVSLVELVHAAGCIDELNFTGVEWVRSAGDLDLYYWVLNSVNIDGLLCGSAGAGDEYGVVGHILESYKAVGFGMNSFFHFLKYLSFTI